MKKLIGGIAVLVVALTVLAVVGSVAAFGIGFGVALGYVLRRRQQPAELKQEAMNDGHLWIKRPAETDGFAPAPKPQFVTRAAQR